MLSIMRLKTNGVSGEVMVTARILDFVLHNCSRNGVELNVVIRE